MCGRGVAAGLRACWIGAILRAINIGPAGRDACALRYPEIAGGTFADDEGSWAEVGSSWVGEDIIVESAELVLITGSADKLPEGIAASGLKLVRKPFEMREVLAALAGRT